MNYIINDIVAWYKIVIASFIQLLGIKKVYEQK
jgi:hypothetical protein